MKKIDIVFFDAGGGHRSAATALKTVAEQSGRKWDIRLVNLQEVLDGLDIFRKVTGVRLEDIYNKMLAKGWTLGSDSLLPLMHGVIRMYHPAQVKMLTRFWGRGAPDLVVSVIPNFNRAMFQGLRRVCPGTPFVTVLTDFADFPPHFWMEKQDQFMVCGTEWAAKQACRMRYRPERIFKVSGMILRPSFYSPHNGNRHEERAKLNLDPDRATGLVLFGGQGSEVMRLIAERLQKSKRKLQMIFICGRNERLADQIRSMPTRIPFHVVGFTPEVPHYMRLSDFFIGKPGPGSISEALACKLPVIIERNSWTLPQERYNADWVEDNEMGIVVQNFRNIVKSVDRLLDPNELARYRANVGNVQNKAIFEILDILDGL